MPSVLSPFTHVFNKAEPNEHLIIDASPALPNVMASYFNFDTTALYSVYRTEHDLWALWAKAGNPLSSSRGREERKRKQDVCVFGEWLMVKLSTSITGLTGFFSFSRGLGWFCGFAIVTGNTVTIDWWWWWIVLKNMHTFSCEPETCRLVKQGGGMWDVVLVAGSSSYC